ncbi:MAG: hypothetical protein QXU97_00370 [Fervidicoccaceae archaeon]
MGHPEVARGVLLLLDSNALLMRAEGLPVEEALSELLDVKPRVLCPRAVIEELVSLRARGGELGRRAERALEIAARICSDTPAAEKAEKADEALLELALELRESGAIVVVATSDRELRGRLRRAGVPTLFYRESQRRFELEREPLI